MIIKNNLHKKGFALGLVLKQRLAAFRKWPIVLLFNKLIKQISHLKYLNRSVDVLCSFLCRDLQNYVYRRIYTLRTDDKYRDQYDHIWTVTITLLNNNVVRWTKSFVNVFLTQKSLLILFLIPFSSS